MASRKKTGSNSRSRFLSEDQTICLADLRLIIVVAFKYMARDKGVDERLATKGLRDKDSRTVRAGLVRYVKNAHC